MLGTKHPFADIMTAVIQRVLRLQYNAYCGRRTLVLRPPYTHLNSLFANTGQHNDKSNTSFLDYFFCHLYRLYQKKYVNLSANE